MKPTTNTVQAKTPKPSRTAASPAEAPAYRLKGAIELILHTRLAQTLLTGDWQVGHLGLPQFAQVIKRLGQAVKEDDPYADWQLLNTYKTLEQTKKQLEAHEAALAQQLDNVRGFKITLFNNPKPLYYPLQALSPLPVMAAVLIERIDYVNRQLFTLARLGLTPANRLTPGHLFHAAQAVFKTPLRWRYTGITRTALLQQTAKAQLVEQQFGKVPPAVLNREIRATFLPRPPAKTPPAEETHAAARDQ